MLACCTYISMVRLIKILFFAMLITPTLALTDKEQVLIFAAASTKNALDAVIKDYSCLLYTSPSPRDQRGSRMPSSA